MAQPNSPHVEAKRIVDDQIETLTAHEISLAEAAIGTPLLSEVQRLAIDETDTITGHEIIYSFVVQRLVKKEAWSFTVDYKAECPNEVTTWVFGVYYEKDPETRDITCSVILKRTDNKDLEVMAFALVTFVDKIGKVVRFSEAVCSGRMSGGDEIQGGIGNGRRNELFNQELVVRISITILDCHVLPQK